MQRNIKLDFRNNGGGKPEVMIAGLLPLFNMSKRKVLTYDINSSKRKKNKKKWTN